MIVCFCFLEKKEYLCVMIIQNDSHLHDWFFRIFFLFGSYIITRKKGTYYKSSCVKFNISKIDLYKMNFFIYFFFYYKLM